MNVINTVCGRIRTLCNRFRKWTIVKLGGYVEKERIVVHRAEILPSDVTTLQVCYRLENDAYLSVFGGDSDATKKFAEDRIIDGFTDKLRPYIAIDHMDDYMHNTITYRGLLRVVKPNHINGGDYNAIPR